jgi:glutamate-1-semialdehyde aminotransferase
MLNVSSSKNLFAKARKIMPGGVNSPVRAWQAVGGSPVLIARGEGPGSMMWTATATLITSVPGGP